MGAVMGCGVGLTIGFIFGSWSILRYVLIWTFEQSDNDFLPSLHPCHRDIM